MKRLDGWLGVAAAALLILPGPAAFAADDPAALRAELDALKTEYEARIAALEARIKQLENAPSEANAPPAVANSPPAPAAVPPTDLPPADLAPPSDAGAFAAAPSRGATAFNPAISLILAGNYANESRDPGTYRIAGFFPSGDEVGPGPRSFNLDESELTVAANVDPYFYANMTAAITGDNELSIEEAYFRTTALPSGFTLKGGRFFSGIGYLNEVHSHAWDFVDQPLVYQAFFNSQLTQDGAQLKWIAPLDTFVELGVETGDGRAFPGTKRDRNGFNGTALFAHVGGDIGDSTSWRTGVSWLDHRAEDREYDDFDALGNPVVDAFTGVTHTWGLDAVLKWAPHGDVTRHQLKVQGEYMHRTESGSLAFDLAGADLSNSYHASESGWYVQAVYQFIPRWRAGLRYDSLQSGTPLIGLVTSGALGALDFPTLLAGSPDRTTMMVDWNPSEFTRIRVQYALDDARLDGRDREFFVQYLYGIGAHGAHKF